MKFFLLIKPVRLVIKGAFYSAYCPYVFIESPISLTKGVWRRKQRNTAHLRILLKQGVWVWSLTDVKSKGRKYIMNIF